MPKKNDVPGLCQQVLSSGTIAYHWKPSPTQRTAGWRNLALGTNYGDAIKRAIARNAEVGAVGPGRSASIQRRIARLTRHMDWCEQEMSKLLKRAAHAARRPDAQYVYFIAAERGLIKIGVTRNPRLRLSGLQTSQGKRLKLLAIVPGGRGVERAYHERFAEHRREGEWFVRHADILAEIRLIKVRAKDAGAGLPTLAHAVSGAVAKQP